MDKVFVNGRSAIHAGATGQSTAFPDVNLCPPGPPAGPVPTPLSNVARAADLAGGASSVLIEGHPMAKRSSYFAKSTGNEVARSTGGGVVTHVVQGKAYFVSYALDISVEGEEVPRHLDLMTHNHAGPNPPNALLGTYIGSQSPAAIPPVIKARKPAAPRQLPASFQMFLAVHGDRAADHADSYQLISDDGRYKRVLAATDGKRQGDAIVIKFENLQPGKRYSLFRLVGGDAEQAQPLFERVAYAALLQDARTPPPPLPAPARAAKAKPKRPAATDPLLNANEPKFSDGWYWAHHRADVDDDGADKG